MTFDEASETPLGRALDALTRARVDARAAAPTLTGRQRPRPA